MKKIKRAAAMFLALCCAAVCLPAAAAGNDEKGLEFKFASPVTLENGKTEIDVLSAYLGCTNPLFCNFQDGGHRHPKGRVQC